MKYLNLQFGQKKIVLLYNNFATLNNTRLITSSINLTYIYLYKQESRTCNIFLRSQGKCPKLAQLGFHMIKCHYKKKYDRNKIINASEKSLRYHTCI